MQRYRRPENCYAAPSILLHPKSNRESVPKPSDYLATLGKLKH
jgi:hypothetical protein